jgi:hypothetical protein
MPGYKGTPTSIDYNDTPQEGVAVSDKMASPRYTGLHYTLGGPGKLGIDAVEYITTGKRGSGRSLHTTSGYQKFVDGLRGATSKYLLNFIKNINDRKVFFSTRSYKEIVELASLKTVNIELCGTWHEFSAVHTEVAPSIDTLLDGVNAAETDTCTIFYDGKQFQFVKQQETVTSPVLRFSFRSLYDPKYLALLDYKIANNVKAKDAWELRAYRDEQCKQEAASNIEGLENEINKLVRRRKELLEGTCKLYTCTYEEQI